MEKKKSSPLKIILIILVSLIGFIFAGLIAVSALVYDMFFGVRRLPKKV